MLGSLSFICLGSLQVHQVSPPSHRKIRYDGAKGPSSNVIPEAPTGWAWSLNQFRSFRWNLTASAARPNPQGSFHYGQINITRTVRLATTAGTVDGKLRYAINGVSHVDPETPMKLAEYYQATEKVFKYDIIKDDPPVNIEQLDKSTLAPIVLNFKHRDFIEIIFENHEKSVHTFHLAGYAFFPVAIEVGVWSPEKRKNYNLMDAVSRYTIQVYPKSWSAILLTFVRHVSLWNIGNEGLERAYLGQQLYVSVPTPKRVLRDEYNLPNNAILCGIVKDMPKPKPYTL